jgi:hypothetical protein
MSLCPGFAMLAGENSGSLEQVILVCFDREALREHQAALKEIVG